MSAPSAFTFLIRFFDRDAELDLDFTCTVFVDSSTRKSTDIAIYSVKSKRMFLKKIAIDSLSNTTAGLSLDDFHIGSTVTILGRRYNVIAYANDATKRYLSARRAEAFYKVGPLSSPTHFDLISSVLNHCAKSGIKLLRWNVACSARRSGPNGSDGKSG